MANANANANAGGGAAGEGEWLNVAQLRALVQAQDPRAKVSQSPTRPLIYLLVRAGAVRTSSAHY
jgi:hypothetical protein